MADSGTPLFVSQTSRRRRRRRSWSRGIVVACRRFHLLDPDPLTTRGLEGERGVEVCTSSVA